MRTKLSLHAVFSFAAVAVLVVGLLWVLLSEPEPKWKGQRLSQWCERVHNPSNPNELNPKAVEAIQGIGTSAIPWLLRDLDARGSWLGSAVTKILRSQSLIKWRFANPGDRLSRGVAGFTALGERGAPAIPELEKMITRTPGYVPAALAGIGHEAVPALCRALTNQHPYVPSNTAAYIANYTAMGRLGSNDLVVLLPLMERQAKSTNNHTAFRVSGALQCLQENGFLEGELSKYRLRQGP